MSRREFFTPAHKPAPPAYFVDEGCVFTVASAEVENLWIICHGLWVVLFCFNCCSLISFFSGCRGKASYPCSVRQHILSAHPTTFSRILTPYHSTSTTQTPVISCLDCKQGLSDWSLCLHLRLQQYFKHSVQSDRFQMWVSSGQFPAQDPVMALLPAGIKARSPPCGCLLPSEVCPDLFSPFLPSLTSAAVPAPARRIPPDLRFPSPGTLSSQISAGLSPPLHSFFCSERSSLYHFLSFFSCLKKNVFFFFTHIVHLFLDSYK